MLLNFRRKKPPRTKNRRIRLRNPLPFPQASRVMTHLALLPAMVEGEAALEEAEEDADPSLGIMPVR
jgi:hypothetical protein